GLGNGPRRGFDRRRQRGARGRAYERGRAAAAAPSPADGARASRRVTMDMTRLVKRFAFGVLVLAAVSSVPAAAQRPLRDGVVQDGVTPGEIQRMFDAYALLQAQEQLKINDAQYTQFLARYKALQDVRRQALQQRTRVVMELQRLLNDPPADVPIDAQ